MTGGQGQGATVLLVCTGNQCRSPMAEALLCRALDGTGITVASAGTAGDGTPPPDHAVEVMAEIGLDIAGRPSRPLTLGALRAAELVVAMGRSHLVTAAGLYPDGWETMFTLNDLLERSRRADPRQPGESVADWAHRMSAGRSRQDLLALRSAGDIPDPMGRGPAAFERTRDQLEAAMTELAGCLSGTPARPGPPARTRRWGRERGR